MNSKLVILAILATLVASSFAAECLSPSVTADSFTTQDSTIVSQIAFVAEFTLKCSNSGGDQVSLFAEVEGRLFPVARIGQNKFQVCKSTRS